MIAKRRPVLLLLIMVLLAGCQRIYQSLKGRKMSSDLCLKNAQVVTENEVFHGGVTVLGEKIALPALIMGPPAECALELEDAAGRKLRILLKGPATAQALVIGRMLWRGEA